jgi:hypothetical protein
MLAYNCSPSFNWEKNLSKEQIASFQQELGKMGYKFQFVTLAGYHALNFSMFELAAGYRDRGMAAYSELQQKEFAREKEGYTCEGRVGGEGCYALQLGGWAGSTWVESLKLHLLCSFCVVLPAWFGGGAGILCVLPPLASAAHWRRRGSLA